MECSRLEGFVLALAIGAVATTGVAFVLQERDLIFGKVAAVSVQIPQVSPPPPPPQKLANPPEIIKSVYVTGYSASSKSYLYYLSNLFKNTEINAVVVDIKGSDGKTGLYDADSLIRFLHDQNIYVIGRIAVFEDPIFAQTHPQFAIYNKAKTLDLTQPTLWKDNNGLAWMDPASKDVWDYDVSLAKDALLNGFDEINFDYVRFPTDGNAGNMGFPIWDDKTKMADTIKSFFHYVRTSLPNDKISVDLFGLTTVDTDDMGIGQVIENAFENFDYISPMVYPSHYANGFIGFANPADHPYEVINYSMASALTKEKTFEKQSKALTSTPTFTTLAKFRPWLQDFNMGANYTAPMIAQEIKATQDALGAEYSGFMLWNPSNIYTQAAILKSN